MFSVRVRSLPSILGSILAGVSALVLTGCALPATAPDAPVSSTTWHGVIFGAGQPVAGAHVYLMTATVSGVGSAGYGLASTSLLQSAQTGLSDSISSHFRSC